jgi:hypothetical protein
LEAQEVNKSTQKQHFKRIIGVINISYEEFAIKLARIIQRLEREGADLTVDDIMLVRKLKTTIGYSVPTSIEDGTGCMINDFFL